MRILLSFAFFIWPLFSWADFYFPTNLRGFDASRDYALNGAKEYDSETESDYLSFSPVSCKHQFLLNNGSNIFCSTVGSLDSSRFLINSLFIFKKELNKKATFRTQWTKDQNYSKNTDAKLIEFLFPLNPKHSIGIHGQLDTKKAQDDAGLSYNYIGDNFFSRFELSAMDFSRNERNEKDDKFIKEPHLASLSFLKTKGDQKYYLGLHYEPEWIWQKDTPTQIVKRKSFILDSFIQYEPYYYGMEYRKARIDVDMNYQKREKFQNHLQYERGRFLSGVRWVRKRWSQAQEELTHYDFLPFVWYRPKEYFSNWHIGYEINWHRSMGDLSLASSLDKLSAIEHRLNLAWVLLNKKNATFKLLFTFDADNIVEETWEGGNGQFTLLF